MALLKITIMNNEWFVFFIATLAVWRTTHLVQAEDGPFNIIVMLRKAAGNSFLGKLMDCFYCLSLWIALPVALLLTRGWLMVLLVWLSLSASSILLNELLLKKKSDIFYKEDD